MNIVKNIMNSLGNIFKSRRYYKEEVRTDLQIKRLSKCKPCVYNSDNRRYKSFKVRTTIKLNKILDWIMGIKVTEDAVCTLCSCNLIHKTSIENETCKVDKW